MYLLGDIIYSTWAAGVDRRCCLAIGIDVVQHHVVKPSQLLLAFIVRRREVPRLP